MVDAVATAATWTAGEWELDDMAAVPRLPSLPVGGLLARAADRIAEHSEDFTGAVHAVPLLEPFPSYAGLDLAPEAWAVLSVADGVRTTGEVAAACGLTLSEAVHAVGALVAEEILRTALAPLGRPVVVPASRRPQAPAAPAPLDNLRVITVPPVAEPPSAELPERLPPTAAPVADLPFVPSPAAPGPDPDTAAFLRELSALTGEIQRIDAAPTATVPAATATTGAAPALPTTAAPEVKPPRRRLFGR
jgi:hypothetical protein